MRTFIKGRWKGQSPFKNYSSLSFNGESKRGKASLKDLLSSELGRLRGALAPLYKNLPPHARNTSPYLGEGDKGGEVDIR